MFLQEKTEDIINLGVWASKIDTYDYKILNNETLIIQIVRKMPLNLGFMLGKFSAYLNLTHMKIFKLFDEKKFFEIQFSEAVDNLDIKFLEEIIHNSFDMNKKIMLRKPIIYPHEIVIETNHSDTLVQMKLDAQDQKGLFAYIASIFDEYEIDIESAKLYTVKKRTKDLLLIEHNANFLNSFQNVLDAITTIPPAKAL